MKFQRRKDLTVERRAWIAILALMGRSKAGLARGYHISRQMVYLLLWSLLEAFSPPIEDHDIFKENDLFDAKQLRDKMILCLKLDGCCSEGDTSAVLKNLNISNNSIGGISEFLYNVANNIPEEIPEGKDCEIIVLGDEIFMGNSPILIVLDAKSHYILRAIVTDERSSQEWLSQYNYVLKSGYKISYVVGDRGEGLVKGCQLAGLTHHPDLMHLIRVFGTFLWRFERKAMQAIAHEYEREAVIHSAKSKGVICKRNEDYTTACCQSKEAIRRYDNFVYLWECLLRAFDLFNKDGSLRKREYVEAEIMAIMELMKKEIKHEPLTEEVQKFKTAIVSYWGYFDRAERIYEELSNVFPNDVLREVCLSWQKERMSRAAKDYSHKKMLEKEAEEHLFLAKCTDIKEIDEKIIAAIKRLQDNVRSSSPLEAINSQVRDFINNARGQITQNMLNLIVFYLNHKRAVRGPYKHTTPWERFTGKKEDGNYLDQLLSLTTKSS